MSDFFEKRPANGERSQKPLWVAVCALTLSVASRGMSDQGIGDVVFIFGGVGAVIAIGYWIFQPSHGVP